MKPCWICESVLDWSSLESRSAARYRFITLWLREWSHYVDQLREDLWKNHPQIQIVDFDFYDVEVFNQCENNNFALIAIENWKYVHPLLKILPVEWDYTIPFGLLHSPEPSPTVRNFLKAVEKIKEENF